MDDRRDVGRQPQVVTCDVADVPADGVLAVADGQVLLARVGGEVVAYRNACLHRGSRLDGGVVRAGTLTCPAHLWRYRLADGVCLNASGALARLPCRVVDGRVEVELPAPAAGSIRDRLLEHARTWRRDE